MDIGGKLEWPGKLEIHTSTRPLSWKQVREVENYAKSSKHPVIAMQVNGDDDVVTYLYNGSWVTPKAKLNFLDAVNAIIRHKGLSVTVPEFFTMIVKPGEA